LLVTTPCYAPSLRPFDHMPDGCIDYSLPTISRPYAVPPSEKNQQRYEICLDGAGSEAPKIYTSTFFAPAEQHGQTFCYALVDQYGTPAQLTSPLTVALSIRLQGSDCFGKATVNFSPVVVSTPNQNPIAPPPATPATDADNDADQDHDSVDDAKDNCPTQFNPSQADDNGNGIGNACDPTITQIPCSANAVLVGVKNCVACSDKQVFDATISQCVADRDGDGVSDTQDACPDIADPSNQCLPASANIAPIPLADGSSGCTLIGAREPLYRNHYMPLLIFVMIAWTIGLAIITWNYSR